MILRLRCEGILAHALIYRPHLLVGKSCKRFYSEATPIDTVVSRVQSVLSNSPPLGMGHYGGLLQVLDY